jgi:hypothetical protein
MDEVSEVKSRFRIFRIKHLLVGANGDGLSSFAIAQVLGFSYRGMPSGAMRFRRGRLLFTPILSPPCFTACDTKDIRRYGFSFFAGSVCSSIHRR